MIQPYKRPITSWERMLNRSPYSIVSMVIRIKGTVTEPMVRKAVDKVQQRHTLLRVRIETDQDQTPWFTSEGVQPIPIETSPRTNENSWLEIYDKACRVPFEFEKRPPIRFYLLQSENISDLLIFCHHVICDGMSLAYLAKDLMNHLGNPDLEVKILPDPLPLNKETLPEGQQLGAFISKIMDKINAKWEPEKIVFDQEDYLNLHETYWKNYTHRTISMELTEEQTNQIVSNCKSNKVTVNSAIAASFAGAQLLIQGKSAVHPLIGIGADLRSRMNPPIEESMGFYAGVVSPKFKYNLKKSMWDNARAFHKKATKLYTEKNFFKDSVTFASLEPSIMEARNYKLIGGLVPPTASRYEKISSFSTREDTLMSLLKRDKAHTLDNLVMGNAITNLTRLDFPKEYGNLELDRLIMQPGGAFPLVTVNFVMGVVTCANKMSLIVEYAEERLDTATVQKIKDLALQNLLSN